MRVLIYDPYPNDAGRAIGEYVTLDELFAQADVIGIHMPLLPSNTGAHLQGKHRQDERRRHYHQQQPQPDRR